VGMELQLEGIHNRKSLSNNDEKVDHIRLWVNLTVCSCSF